MTTRTQPKKNTIRRVTVASFIGSMVEWYDFFLYGTAAALVFGPLFFPDLSASAGLIAAFATYAVGFLARPVGALIGGHYGDRVGRKMMLVATLMVMGLSTMAIGALPTYETGGLIAPILLLVLRLMQGLGAGAEWGGAVLMTVETAPLGKRGFYSSFTQSGISGGMLAAVGVFSLVRMSMPEDEFMSWGWRIPFLASGLLVVFGYYLRKHLDESESFVAMKEQGNTASNPLGELARNERKAVWLTIGMRLSQNAMYYLFTTFSIAYIAKQVGGSSNIGTNAVTAASALGLVTVILWAALSDKIGRKPVYLFGVIASALFIGPFFLLLDTGNQLVIIVAMVVGLCLFHDPMYGPQAAFFSEMFSARVRYSGASIGYQFGAAISGGFAPLIAAVLLEVNNGRPWLIVVYAVILSLITATCTYLAPETSKVNIDAELEKENVTIAGRANIVG